MKQATVFVNAENKLYIAYAPKSPEDMHYPNADDWLLTALQICGEATLAELLVHVQLLQQDRHPTQLQLLSRGVQTFSEDVPDYVISARRDLSRELAEFTGRFAEASPAKIQEAEAVLLSRTNSIK